MSARLKRHYHKEEEFLEEFSAVAVAAVGLLDGAWSPDYGCDDAARQRQSRFLASGEATRLFFDSAAVYHDGGFFSSAQIILRSSFREVTVRVRRDGESFSAEKVVDRALPNEGCSQ